MKSTLLWACLLLGLPAVAGKKPKASKKDELITITTAQGVVRLILFEDTPLHRANFLKRVKAGLYDGTTFHRVIPGFMVQGGDPNSKDSDPNNDGLGPPNEPTVPAEIRPQHLHDHGALAAARTADFVNPARNSSGSQFYLVQNRQGAHQLDGQYTVYGQVVQGLDVLDKLANVPRDARDRPLTDLKMTVTMTRLKKKKITELYGYSYPASLTSTK